MPVLFGFVRFIMKPSFGFLTICDITCRLGLIKLLRSHFGICLLLDQSARHYPTEREVSSRLRSLCPFGKFLPSRSGNCQQNFLNGNVDKARTNFPFGLDSNISPFLTSCSGISCAYSSKARASHSKN